MVVKSKKTLMNDTIKDMLAQALLMAGLALGSGSVAYAQHYLPVGTAEQLLEEGRTLVADGKYYGASVNLKEYMSRADASPALAIEAQALKLVCDYYLNVPGTEQAMAEWTQLYPQSVYAERLNLMRANLLTWHEKYDEALTLFRRFDADNLSDYERDESRLCEAIALINTDEIDEAEALLKMLQEGETHQMDVVYYTGYVKYVKGDYKGALEDFTLVSKEADYEAKVPVYMADCHLHLGQPQKSLSILNNQLPSFSYKDVQVQENKRYEDEIHRIRGEAYYDTQNYSKAIETLGQYIYNVESPRRTALYKLAMSYMQLQEYQQAAPMFSRSADTSDDEMAQSAWLNAGICYVHTQNKKQAQIAFQQASQMTANKSLQEEALYNYALTLHEGHTMGFGESVTVFEQFLNMFPESQYASSVSKHLSEVYFTTKNYKAALESINKIKNPGKDMKLAKQRVLYNLGVQEFIAEHYKESDAFMDQSIELGSKEGYFIRGESKYRQGQYKAAISDLKQYMATASKRATNYGLAQYSCGYAYFKQKDYKNAGEQFQALAGLPNVTSVTRADGLNRLGDCLFTNRQYDDAFEAYGRALEADKQLGDYSLYQQAYIEGLRGNYEEKVALLGQMNSRYANSRFGAEARYEQALAYMQTGKKDEALAIFANLIARYPLSQIARNAGNEMGWIYYEQGNIDAALEAYNNVIEKYPNTAEAHTALANLKDIYTDQNRIEEYAVLAQKAGKELTSEELDQMLSEAAVRSITNENYEQAYRYYDQLVQQTQSEELRMTALEGLMRSAFNTQDYEATISAANQLIEDSKTSPALVYESLLFRAEANFALDHSDLAVADLQELSKDEATIYGAQGRVRLAQYAFDTEQYKSAEEILTAFVESGTTHQYWLARAFILLSDVYKKTNRKVEAKEYLLSLKSNYNENEEINQMIEERLK